VSDSKHITTGSFVIIACTPRGTYRHLFVVSLALLPRRFLLLRFQLRLQLRCYEPLSPLVPDLPSPARTIPTSRSRWYRRTLARRCIVPSCGVMLWCACACACDLRIAGNQSGLLSLLTQYCTVRLKPHRPRTAAVAGCLLATVCRRPRLSIRLNSDHPALYSRDKAYLEMILLYNKYF